MGRRKGTGREKIGKWRMCDGRECWGYLLLWSWEGTKMHSDHLETHFLGSSKAFTVYHSVEKYILL